MTARKLVAAAAELTGDQRLIAHLFGLMDERRQNEALRYATDIAKAFPRSAAPAVRIVKGGGV